MTGRVVTFKLPILLAACFCLFFDKAIASGDLIIVNHTDILCKNRVTHMQELFDAQKCTVAPLGYQWPIKNHAYEKFKITTTTNFIRVRQGVWPTPKIWPWEDYDAVDPDRNATLTIK